MAIVKGTNRNDVLVGTRGTDSLLGMDGNDLLLAIGRNKAALVASKAASGLELLNGGIGRDTVSYEAWESGLVIYLGKDEAQNIGGNTAKFLSIENLIGGRAGDRLVGNGAANTLHGMGGNDSLSGGHGNDRLDGGSGNDLLLGGIGADRIVGGAGTDTVSYAGVLANLKIDLRLTGAQNTLGAGIDTLLEIEAVVGGSRNDNISGNGAANRLAGGAGKDMIAGQGGGDTLSGGDSADTLSGGSGNDHLSGGGGGDTLDGGAGHDTLDGGTGTDTAAYAGNYAVSVELNQGFAEQLIQTEPGGDVHGTYLDVLIGIENATGSSNRDRLIGNDLDNVLRGEGEDDWLMGGLGNDILDGGAGNDTFQLGLDLDLRDRAIDVDLAFTDGPNLTGIGTDTLLNIENVYGGGGDDTLAGDDGNNILEGGDGRDTLTGRAGNDLLYAGQGTEVDTLSGGQGNDLLYGGPGSDRVSTGAGKDIVFYTEDIVLHDPEGAVIAQNITRVAAGVMCDVITDLAPSDILAFVADYYDPNEVLGIGHLVDGLNFSTITGAYDGTDAGGNVNFAEGAAAFVFSQFDDTLYYDANGAEAGYLAIATLGNGASLRAEQIVLSDTISIMFGKVWQDAENPGLGEPTPEQPDDEGLEDPPPPPPVVDQTVVGSHASEFWVWDVGGNDHVDGRDGDDWLAGGRGNDILLGGTGDDFLSGEGGNDTLQGGAGNDEIWGYMGHDTLVGGAGNDVFFFYDSAEMPGERVGTNVTRAVAGAQPDIVLDFEPGETLQFRSEEMAPNQPLGPPVDAPGNGETWVYRHGNDVQVSLSDGIDFSTIDTLYDGTDAGENTNFDQGLGTFVFSTADNTLYYDGNGEVAGYSVIAEVASGNPITAGDIRIVIQPPIA